MSQPAHLSFDATALTEPVDRAAVTAFSRTLPPSLGNGTAAAWIVAAVFVFVGVINLGLFFATLGASDGRNLLMLIVPVIFLCIAPVIVVVALRGGSKTVPYRLSRFAQANGLEFVPQIADPGLPGMVFRLGHSRVATNLLRGQQPRFVEFGNYRYTTGSGKNRTTHRWGYVAVKIDNLLPHIVLDAKGNNSLLGSNLPVVYQKEQRLKLEGDFDSYFSLYCPAGYEADALYLFTPDIMQRFIAHAAELDVEIVDDWLFLYAKRDLSTLDPATWSWLFGTVQAVLQKLSQWERWRDDRLATAPAAAAPFAAGVPVAADAPLRPPPGVALPGRRLKTRFAWVPILIAVGWILLQIAGRIIESFAG